MNPKPKFEKVVTNLTNMDGPLETLSGLAWVLELIADQERGAPGYVVRSLGRVLTETACELDHERQRAEATLSQHVESWGGHR